MGQRIAGEQDMPSLIIANLLQGPYMKNSFLYT